jgi:hypothetical protein
MNVVLKSVDSKNVSSCKRVEGRGYIFLEPPVDGYWELVWESAQEGAEPITGILEKAKAESIARALNSLPREQAVELVKALHARGGQMQAVHASRNQRYSGRSFEWPRT